MSFSPGPSGSKCITSFRSKLEEVYPQSLEMRLDGFQRDVHPDTEVAWWERVAGCYVAYNGQVQLNPRL
jgi:hypothetical protein